MTTRFASRFAARGGGSAHRRRPAPRSRSRHHGHGGPGGGDFVMGIAALKAQLNLNTSQQAMWDNAVAAGKAARDSARANHAEGARRADGRAREARAGSRRGRRGRRQRAEREHRGRAAAGPRRMAHALRHVHAGPEGRRARTALQQRVARMEQFREKMQQRRGSDTARHACGESLRRLERGRDCQPAGPPVRLRDLTLGSALRFALRSRRSPPLQRRGDDRLRQQRSGRPCALRARRACPCRPRRSSPERRRRARRATGARRRCREPPSARRRSATIRSG